MLNSLDRQQISVVTDDSRYNEAFKTLNIEWLEKYFNIEPIDHQVLSHPEKIIEAGGHIFFACQGTEAVGTCALIRKDQRFELSKMAVSQAFQQQGIGRRLLMVAIQKFETYPLHTMYLETNSILVPAITLYESLGFVHAQRPGGPSPYERANVFMNYLPSRVGV